MFTLRSFILGAGTLIASCLSAQCTNDSDCDGIPNSVDECPVLYGVIGSPCTDGLTCTINDVVNASCVCAGTPVVCNDNNPCTTSACVEGLGCVHTNAPGICDDGNPCTTNDQCNNGACTGTALPDSDGDGICNALDNCPSTPGQIGSLCNDGLTCTINDVVSASCVCAGTPVVCNDNNPCTTSACVEGLGCVHTNAPGTCDDGNPCTTNDQCNNGACTGTALPDSDGDGICNALDNCPSTPGQIGSLCNDGLTCTINDVVSASCVCAGTPVVCNDNNPCTTSACVEGLGCVHTNAPGTCDDGNPCTTNDQCNNGACTGTALPDSDGDGICNALDNCPSTPGQIGSLCNDGLTCTINDVVSASCVCAGTPVVCNDNNPCTTSACVEGLGCVHTNAPGTCDDGNPCTTNDQCNNGACTGTALPDSDGDGICNALDNCPSTPGQIGSACNDGLTCTINDVVSASCVCAGTPVVCNDNNPCTTSACVEGLGCVHTNAPGTCDDGNPCTTNDQCNNGACTGTALPDSDGDGICNALDNCPNTPGQIGSACNDGLTCTINDVVSASCVCAGTPVVCNDNNPCTTSACVEGLGCVHTNAPGTCDDGNPCTTNDQCNNGVCAGTVVPDNDGDGLCNTVDPCPSNPAPLGSACNDNKAFTYNDVITADCVCSGVPGRINVKVFLEGPYGGGTMLDVLRANGLLPLTEPYTALGYTFVGNGGPYSIPVGVRNTGGPNAVVDWLVLELRSKTSPGLVVHSRAALVQRDGDVVDMDGASSPGFPLAAGPYLLAVRHRNHLPVMVDIGSPLALGQTSVSVDLTLPSTTTYGTDARKNIGGVMALWTGDVNFDNTLKYTGTGNDRDPVLVAIGGAVPTVTLNNQYRTEDINLDGSVKYTGTANDRDPILINVGGTVPTQTRQGQLP